MPRLLILALLLFSQVSVSQQLVIREQKIQVSGNTSLGEFKCSYRIVGLQDTLLVDSRRTSAELGFKVPVRDFGCGNFLLNKDFRATVKAEEFPFVEVRVWNLQSDRQDLVCDMTVGLVGQCLDLRMVPLRVTKEGLTARLSLSFENLNMNPPTRFGGLVRVEDQLDLTVMLGF